MRIKANYFTIILLILTILCSGRTGKTEERVYQVGILSGLDFLSSTINGFKDKMTELGYIEGRSGNGPDGPRRFTTQGGQNN